MDGDAETPEGDPLVARAREAVGVAAWVVGECAHRWCRKWHVGGGDAAFGELVGVSRAVVRRARRAWESCRQYRGRFPSLTYTHLATVADWPEAEREPALAWAAANGATVLAMRNRRQRANGGKTFGTGYTPARTPPAASTAARAVGPAASAPTPPTTAPAQDDAPRSPALAARDKLAEAVGLLAAAAANPGTLPLSTRRELLELSNTVSRLVRSVAE